MSPMRSAALLWVICTPLVACNGPSGDLTEPNMVPTDPAVSALLAPLSFRQLSAGTGNGHTCGVTLDSLAYCWGYNGTGAVGDGSNTRRLKPTAVAGIRRYLQVTTGYDFSCGVTSGMRAFCWGSNSFGANGGQLGDGTTTDRSKPVAVLGGLQFRQVSAGLAHTCGRTTGNRIYCWGSNVSGQLGDGTQDNHSTPVRVAGTLQFRQVSVGWNHSCGVTTDNRAFCWGQNGSGQVGNSSNASLVLSPALVAGEHQFLQVDAGGFHTCGVTSDGRALCWGQNTDGQIGDGTHNKRVRPRLVLGGLSFKAVEAGSHHSCGVTTTNLAYCWGSNQTGSLGDGTMGDHAAPTAVGGGHKFSQVTAGGFHSCGRTPGAAGFCWGDNFNGALGDGTTMQRLLPRAIVGP
jgi:alpha-tubulin suppressor-like RCC1 family protein